MCINSENRRMYGVCLIWHKCSLAFNIRVFDQPFRIQVENLLFMQSIQCMQSSQPYSEESQLPFKWCTHVPVITSKPTGVLAWQHTAQLTVTAQLCGLCLYFGECVIATFFMLSYSSSSFYISPPCTCYLHPNPMASMLTLNGEISFS